MTLAVFPTDAAAWLAAARVAANGGPIDLAIVRQGPRQYALVTTRDHSAADEAAARAALALFPEYAEVLR